MLSFFFGWRINKCVAPRRNLTHRPIDPSTHDPFSMRLWLKNDLILTMSDWKGAMFFGTPQKKLNHTLLHSYRFREATICSLRSRSVSEKGHTLVRIGGQNIHGLYIEGAKFGALGHHGRSCFCVLPLGTPLGKLPRNFKKRIPPEKKGGRWCFGDGNNIYAEPRFFVFLCFRV